MHMDSILLLFGEYLMQVTLLPQLSTSSEVVCRDSHDPSCTTKLHQQHHLDPGLMAEPNIKDL